MGNFFDNSEILNIIKNRKRHLLIIALVALVVSVFISSPWIMKPKFKAYAVLYPSNISPYGEESPTEQMLELLGSEEISKAMIEKFKLGEHYKVDTGYAYYQTEVNRIFHENVSVNKTEFEAVQIEVVDRDPKYAYEMVNEMIARMNETVRAMHRKKYAEIYAIAESNYLRKGKEIDSLEKVVQELRSKYGILDYAIQVKEATRKYYRAGGADARLADATTMLRNLEQKGEEYIECTYNLNAARESYVIFKKELDNAYKELHKVLSFADMVTNPKVPDKKFWPVRWIIVSVFTSSILFASLVFFLFTDHKRKAKVVIKDLKTEETPVLS